MPHLEEALILQSKINELYPKGVLEAIAENARLFGKIPANILNAPSLAISSESLRKLQECANLAAKVFPRDMSPFLKASRAASMADTGQSLSRLRAEVIELEKRFPAPEKILDGLFDLETDAAQDAIAIPDGSLASVALAETVAALRESVDEIKKRLDHAPTEEEIPAGDEKPGIKPGYVFILAFVFLLVIPNDADQAANILLHMATCALNLTANVKAFTNGWGGVISLIGTIITLANHFKKKD